MRAKLNGAFELGLALMCAACVWPLFYVRYPPLQDLPQHLAAVRVLHDYGNPAFGFQQWFTLDLLDTQYLSYYLAAHGLSYLVDVELANRLLIAVMLIAIPYATRALLESLGKDGRVCVLTLPLAYNAHLILGFFNFIAAIPLCLYGVALAVRLRRAYSHGRALWLALCITVCFYTHVVPFALLALSVGLIGCTRDLPAAVRGLAPLVPACGAALIWTRTSPAGQATASAAGGAAQAVKPEFQPAAVAMREVPRWLTDVLGGPEDLRLLIAWALLLALVFVLATVERALGRMQPAPDRLGASLALRLWAIPPICVLAYFVLPTGYAWIWPIAPRFPLLCALWLVVVLPRFSLGRPLVLALALLLSGTSFHLVGKAFARFEREEVGDFDQALQTIPPRQRVVGLVFERYSSHVAFAPFLQYVAYYQARRGGLVMFSFADFPQSPFHFRADRRPPPVPPRWEWLPQRVRPSELRFYDYALVRGGPGLIGKANSGFELLHRGTHWSVWRQRGLR
jgi:hypothetical protein